MSVEERLNVRFNFIPVRGAWDHKDEFLRRIRNTVSAGDHEFDIINGYAAYIVELTTAGAYLKNWREIPYIGFDKPWWNQQFNDEMTINNRQFYMTGDLALSTVSMANVLFFNKKMWQSYGMEDPYAIVKEGSWTLDRMASFTKQVSADLDGDGRFTEADLYGYVTDTHNQIDAYVISFDVPITVKDEDGLPRLVVEDEKFSYAFLRLFEFTRQTVSTFAGTDQPTATDIYSMYRPIFQQERALMLAEYLGNSAEMRAYEFDFGILPFPKLNDRQERYLTMPQNGYTMFCVPVTVRNPEMVGAVMEALASESRRSVVPAFYDVALKTKYARDEESAEMIDIIRDGISFSFGAEYVVPLGHPHLEWRTLITANRDNIVSSVERQINTWNSRLERILEAYLD
jgi:ABC-type glycerol-3-phosphate transport system substrate-binding protein